MTLPVVGIVCALASEAQHLSPKGWRSRSIAQLGDGTRVIVSGMGPDAASAGARALIESGATALVSWGMAGGLDPALRAGAVFLPEEIIDAEGAVVTTAGHWRRGLGAAIADLQPLTQGRLLSSPRALATVVDKAQWFQRTAAVAVDMESYAVGKMAQMQRLPFVAVRVIVDSASDALPEAVAAAADLTGHLRVGRLLAALARTPTELGSLIRLGRRYRCANRSLAAVARAGSLAPHADPTSRDVFAP